MVIFLSEDNSCVSECFVATSLLLSILTVHCLAFFFPPISFMLLLCLTSRKTKKKKCLSLWDARTVKSLAELLRAVLVNGRNLVLLTEYGHTS